MDELDELYNPEYGDDDTTLISAFRTPAVSRPLQDGHARPLQDGHADDHFDDPWILDEEETAMLGEEEAAPPALSPPHSNGTSLSHSFLFPQAQANDQFSL